MHRILLTLSVLMLLFNAALHAEPIVPAGDLAADAQAAREENKPIVFFITAAHCPYCERLRDEYFKFSPGDKRFILRELVLDQNPDVVGFSGESSSHREIAAEYDISLTPTVAFVDSDGHQLTDPIIGVLTMDFYHYYFEEALGKSIDRLKGNRLAQQ